MDFSLERPDTPHPVLSKYDKKLRANSKSELPQKKRDKDNDKDKEESQLRLSSLTTDLTSCRGIGACDLPSFLSIFFCHSSSCFLFSFCVYLLLTPILTLPSQIRSCIFDRTIFSLSSPTPLIVSLYRAV